MLRPIWLYCIISGMTNSTRYPCPAGYYCYRGENPHLCPAGRMRNETGAGEPDDCPLCRGGYYCPNDTENMNGIPCEATFECPLGSALPTLCRPGYYCDPVTGDPPICPPGYYCSGGTYEPVECNFPDYCPEGSNMTLQCDLGYQALAHAGIRYDVDQSCRICPAGTYGNSTDRSECRLCPPGYYCPEGTGHGDTNPCAKGTYCPEGSPEPTNCPTGTYGTILMAASRDDCSDCPTNTFQDVAGQTECKPCGGTSGAGQGSSSCTCNGKYRSFQPFLKKCSCLGGYRFYGESDKQFTDEDGQEDCQQIVRERCSAHQTRRASDGRCVDEGSTDCSSNARCQSSGGGTFDSIKGRYVYFTCWVILYAFCLLPILFLNQLFLKILSGISPQCQTV